MEVASTAKWRIIFNWFGVLLIRLIVPAWILFGALAKVRGATPKSLPRSILDTGESLGISDHFLLLSVLTSIEFLFIGVMLFIPMLARKFAITILSIFLIVLCVEIYRGSVSCGCLGEHSLDPKVMFAIDFLMLLGAILCKPNPVQIAGNKWKKYGPILACSFIAITWFYTFTSIQNAKKSNSAITEGNLPASWYPRDLSSWSDVSINDIDLFSFVENWPHDINDGKQYVIFYGRNCDHCEELLYMHFEFDLRAPTTLVAIPESIDGFIGEGGFDNPCFDCDVTELPIGVDWIIGTPLVIAIDNGVIKCAVENEQAEIPVCLIW
ncbi:MAG: hypothetical protein VX436_01040 [Planctomycetota bacterium]|nr:hypothetical protein [Planctomycetota bacterium]